MVYNELEQGDTLSEVRVGVAPLAYTDILLRSIWAIFKIRQTPGHVSPLSVTTTTIGPPHVQGVRLNHTIFAREERLVMS